MPMVPANAITRIQARLATKGFKFGGDIQTGKDFLSALVEEIIAEVRLGTIVVTVASVSGVTTGPGVSGPGAGTGVIT